MNLQFDHTYIHHLGEVLEKNRNLDFDDAMLLLRAAEQLLFSNQINLIDFERPKIMDDSHRVYETLYDIGFSGENEVLSFVSTSSKDYANSCDEAAVDLNAELTYLDRQDVWNLGKQATIHTRPSGVRELPLQAWFGQDQPQIQNNSELIVYLNQNRAFGCFDYIMARNSRVRSIVQSLGRGNEPQKRLAAMGMTVIFRAAVNKQLSLAHGSIYCPAPARAALLNSHALSLKDVLVKAIVDTEQRTTVDKQLGEFDLPLPVMALFLLKNERPKSALELMEATLRARESPEARILRAWLHGLSKSIEVGAHHAAKGELEVGNLVSEARQFFKNSDSFGYSLFLSLANPLLKRINLANGFDLKLDEIPGDIKSLVHAVQSSRRRLLIGRMLRFSQDRPDRSAFSIVRNIIK